MLPELHDYLHSIDRIRTREIGNAARDYRAGKLSADEYALVRDSIQEEWDHDAFVQAWHAWRDILLASARPCRLVLKPMVSILAREGQFWRPRQRTVQW